MSPAVKALTEYGPLAVFFIANARFDIFVATAAFMVAITLALVVTFVLTRKIAKMPLITAVFVLVFGGLTLWLNDELFIKIKPTLVYVLFAVILFGGYMVRRYFLADLLGNALQLATEGWRQMTLRWVVFFIALAILNEYVWRHYSTDMWVNLKVFGFAPLTIIFAMAQMGLIKKYMIEDDTA